MVSGEVLEHTRCRRCTARSQPLQPPLRLAARVLEPSRNQHPYLQHTLQPTKLLTSALPRIPNTEHILDSKYKAKKCPKLT